MPKQPFEPVAYGEKDGSITVLLPDVWYPDNHPAFKAHPEWFRDLADVEVVEMATAAPGEKRASARTK